MPLTWRDGTCPDRLRLETIQIALDVLTWMPMPSRGIRRPLTGRRAQWGLIFDGRRRRSPGRRHLPGQNHRQKLTRPGVGFVDCRLRLAGPDGRHRAPQLAYFYVGLRLGGG